MYAKLSLCVAALALVAPVLSASSTGPTSPGMVVDQSGAGGSGQDANNVPDQGGNGGGSDPMYNKPTPTNKYDYTPPAPVPSPTNNDYGYKPANNKKNYDWQGRGNNYNGGGGGGNHVGSCDYGRGKKMYNQGYRQGAAIFQISWQALDKNCDQLDFLKKSLVNSCPFSDSCQREGYMTAVNKAYTKAQQGCFTECAGTGKETGHRLGVQFCQIAAAAPALMSSDNLTKAVCNAVESTTCYSTFDEYVQGNCPELMDSNMDYYQQLSDVCQITTR